MKIVAISDTHSKHDLINLPEGDILIHAGDISKRGHSGEIKDFIKWFTKLPFRYKIFIAGNHDFGLETGIELVEQLPDNLIYLNDSGVTIEDIKIWGSPIQPWFHDWAFNRQRGEEINKHWKLIPKDTNILITHGPPKGFLDKTTYGDLNAGCYDLLKKVEEVKPKYHIFGHIHEGYGVADNGTTKFINASSLNLSYQPVNAPVVFDYV